MGKPEDHAYERRWWILALLCFSLLVIVLDNSILNVALPTIVDQLHADNSQLQWMVDSYTLVFAGLLLTMGSLGDKYGRRGALQAGFIIFGLGSIASAMTTTPNQLIATRAFMGIGGALIMPATLSIITNTFPAHERGRAIGMWAGVAGLGGALGPLTGGFLVERFYFGSVFLVNVPIVIVGLICGVFLIPTSKDPSSPRLDPVGAVLSIVALTSLLYAIIEGPTEGFSDPKIVTGFVVGAVLLVVFALWERHSTHPMLDVNLFKNPRFTAASGSITLTFFAMFGAIFLLTQYFQFVLGYAPFETGVRMLPFAATMLVVAPASARVVERIGTKVTVAVGMGLITSGLLLMLTSQVDSPYSTIWWKLVLVAAGMGFVMAPATESVMGSLPLAKAGVGSAVNDTTRQVGGALGVAVLGSVLSATYSSVVGNVFAGTPVPADAVEAAKTGLGGTQVVAQTIRSQPIPGAGALADKLIATANQAFVDGFHHGLLVAAAFTGAGIILAAVFLPAHARSEDDALQQAEFVAEHADEADIPAEVLAPHAPDHGPVGAGAPGRPPAGGPEPVEPTPALASERVDPQPGL
jgi:EmrB/QacA subfamily drug resistance transporter